MAEETISEEVKPAEVTEDDLRNLIGEVLDEKLSGISEGIGGIVDSVVEKMKGESGTDDSMLEKIGGMIDEKLKGLSSGSKPASDNPSGNGEARIPKIRIFS